MLLTQHGDLGHPPQSGDERVAQTFCEVFLFRILRKILQGQDCQGPESRGVVFDLFNETITTPRESLDEAWGFCGVAESFP
jgi:hypothetical protein